MATVPTENLVVCQACSYAFDRTETSCCPNPCCYANPDVDPDWLDVIRLTNTAAARARSRRLHHMAASLCPNQLHTLP